MTWSSSLGKRSNRQSMVLLWGDEVPPVRKQWEWRPEMILVPSGPGVGWGWRRWGGWKCKASNRQQRRGSFTQPFSTDLRHKDCIGLMWHLFLTFSVISLNLKEAKTCFLFCQHSDRLKAFVIEVSKNTEEGKGKTFIYFFFLSFNYFFWNVSEKGRARCLSAPGSQQFPELASRSLPRPWLPD